MNSVSQKWHLVIPKLEKLTIQHMRINYIIITLRVVIFVVDSGWQIASSRLRYFKINTPRIVISLFLGMSLNLSYKQEILSVAWKKISSFSIKLGFKHKRNFYQRWESRHILRAYVKLSLTQIVSVGDLFKFL